MRKIQTLCKKIIRAIRSKNSFTLIELILVLVMIAILAAVIIPRVGDYVKTAKITGTEKEMMELARAITGDPEEGFYGFANDVGAIPSVLSDLYKVSDPNPSPYNPFTRSGWNGPYVDADPNKPAGEKNDIEIDAWGHDYVYSSTDRTITSYGPDGVSGGGDDIVVQLQ
jgi:general secretion pathway protein G